VNFKYRHSFVKTLINIMNMSILETFKFYNNEWVFNFVMNINCIQPLQN
jgi:hypothetical protein